MRKAIFYFLYLWILSAPVFAGTVMKAHLESRFSKESWVDVDGFIDQFKLRLDFKGPTSHGSLIYDRETSQITLLDHFHKTILELTQDNQAGVKILLAIFAGQLERQVAGTNVAAKRAYDLVAENARVVFNGSPTLRQKGVGVEGFVCDEYSTELDGKPAREVWVTTPDQAGMSSEDYNTLRSLAHLTVDLCGSVFDQLGADTQAFQQNLLDSELPVMAVFYAKGKAASRFKILSIRTQTIDLDIFNPPAHYQALSLMDLLRGGSTGRP